MPNPPIVWHLDTEGIQPFRYNPNDRLTRIKEIMEAFQAEDSKISLRQVLRQIEEICNETNTTDPPDEQA